MTICIRKIRQSVWCQGVNWDTPLDVNKIPNLEIWLDWLHEKPTELLRSIDYCLDQQLSRLTKEHFLVIKTAQRQDFSLDIADFQKQ